jgi:hypothetical protein
MPSRHAVLLTLSPSIPPYQLPYCQQLASVNPLDATLARPLAGAANKRLTKNISPVDATLTKNREWEALLPSRAQSRSEWGCSSFPIGTKIRSPLCFQPLTNCPFSIPFVLTFIHRMGGRGSPMKSLKYYFNFLKYRPPFPGPLTRAYPSETVHYSLARKFDGSTPVLLQSSRVQPDGPALGYLRRNA